jgi:hypothetical protein
MYAATMAAAMVMVSKAMVTSVALLTAPIPAILPAPAPAVDAIRAELLRPALGKGPFSGGRWWLAWQSVVRAPHSAHLAARFPARYKGWARAGRPAHRPPRPA